MRFTSNTKQLNKKIYHKKTSYIIYLSRNIRSRRKRRWYYFSTQSYSVPILIKTHWKMKLKDFFRLTVNMNSEIRQ